MILYAPINKNNNESSVLLILSHHTISIIIAQNSNIEHLYKEGQKDVVYTGSLYQHKQLEKN